MTAPWPPAQAVPEVPADYGYLITLLVAAIPLLIGALIWMERRFVGQVEASRAQSRELYEARIADRDKHIDRQDRVIEAMTTSLRDLTTSVNRLADRVEDIEAPPAPRTRTARRGGG